MTDVKFVPNVTPINADWLNNVNTTVNFNQPGMTSSSIPLLKKVQNASVSLTDFYATGNGVTDDTVAIQKAFAYLQRPDTPKELVIPNGVNGVYVLTSPINITTGGITIRWENSNIRIKKMFNGEVFVVRAGVVKFINPGIDGNAMNGFSGGGIRFGPASQFTFDCLIDNPRIFGTQDSCILYEGPRGGAGIEVRGGSTISYNPSGVSSGGYPGSRVVGPSDTEPSDRRYIGVTSSAQPLIDLTGMWVTKISNCFTGTILFKGNPDVTGIGGPYTSCAEVFIDQTYIRDGLTISGLEIMVDNCLSHGHAPIFGGTYGSTPTGSETYGWAMTNDTIACRIGSTNVVSNGVVDNSPDGHAIENQCSSFSYGAVMNTVWTATSTNPNIGNGSVLSQYDIDYKTVNFRLKMTTGTTTTLGSGQWSFDLPKWVSLFTPAIGDWVMFRPGLGWSGGKTVLTATGSIHRISLLDYAGNFVSDASPVGGFPVGTQLYIDYSYSRG